MAVQIVRRKQWWKFWSTERSEALIQREIELQTRVDYLQEELKTKERIYTREQEDLRQSLILQHKEKEAVFNLSKKEWEQDKARMIKLHEEEKELFTKRLKEELELKHNETLTLLKLESQQKVLQAELDRDRKINEMKAESDRKTNEAIKKLQEENYTKLSTELAKLHSEGNATTQFIQELSLKMLDKAPGLNAHVTKVELPVGSS